MDKSDKIVTLNANLKKASPWSGQVRSGQVRSRSDQGTKMGDSDLTISQVDLIQTNDCPADSCAVSPTAFPLAFIPNTLQSNWKI